MPVVLFGISHLLIVLQFCCELVVFHFVATLVKQMIENTAQFAICRRSLVDNVSAVLMGISITYC